MRNVNTLQAHSVKAVQVIGDHFAKMYEAAADDKSRDNVETMAAALSVAFDEVYSEAYDIGYGHGYSKGAAESY